MTLSAFFRQYDRVALAFSGGVDSAYLLYEAVRLGVDVRPYYVKSAFQPAFELVDARRLAQELRQELIVLSADVLADPVIAANPADRCYHCKRLLFSVMADRARADGYPVLLDGTNASDDSSDRPGMRALAELAILSPLRLCSLTKSEIRRLSREAGLFTWNKPAYACLATRIPTGEPITAEWLATTERAEAFLVSLGFRDIRVRLADGAAKIQVPAQQMEHVLACREEILHTLGQWYHAVLLDLKARR